MLLKPNQTNKGYELKPRGMIWPDEGVAHDAACQWPGGSPDSTANIS